MICEDCKHEIVTGTGMKFLGRQIHVDCEGAKSERLTAALSSALDLLEAWDRAERERHAMLADLPGDLALATPADVLARLASFLRRAEEAAGPPIEKTRALLLAHGRSARWPE